MMSTIICNLSDLCVEPLKKLVSRTNDWLIKEGGQNKVLCTGYYLPHVSRDNNLYVVGDISNCMQGIEPERNETNNYQTSIG